MPVVNLTRKSIPAISRLSSQNKESVNAMPEMVLAAMSRKGDKNIVHVGMNECKAARILPEGIHTIYTDGIASCNAVGVVLKGKDGFPIAILSHYSPLPASKDLQAEALEKQLATYDYFIDKTKKPKLFFNVPGYEDEGQLKPCVNNIFEKIKTVMDRFFNKNYDEQTILYKGKNRPPFFSSANIFQFDTKNPNKLKITTVGEQEHFINLNV